MHGTRIALYVGEELFKKTRIALYVGEEFLKKLLSNIESNAIFKNSVCSQWKPCHKDGQ